MLAGGHLDLLGIDAVVQHIEALEDFRGLPSEVRRMLGASAKSADKRLVDLRCPPDATHLVHIGVPGASRPSMLRIDSYRDVGTISCIPA
jgi:hypothetical protein